MASGTTTQEELEEFERQLALEEEEKRRKENASDGHTYKDEDGTEYEWDENKRAWFPKITEDFMVQYQSQYGYQDASEPAEQSSNKKDVKEPAAGDEVEAGGDIAAPSDVQPPSAAGSSNDAEEAPQVGANILKKKGLKNVQKRPASWFEQDDSKNTKVYVSGLPLVDFDEEKFVEMMSKYGMIFKDETGKHKIKLYRDEDGDLKGDGLCTYIKVESVELCLQLLDGLRMGDNEIHVERAKFQLKGEYDPSKKPKQMKRKDKEKLKKKIDKLFAWKPDKLRGERNKCENTVVIKNFFSPSEFDEDARLILEYQKDLREECQEKFGEVKKVVIYDRNPEGVATVTFTDVEHADECIAVMHGRFFAGRQLEASHWDGKTKYKVVESEEQLEARMKKWDEFLEKAE